MTEYKFTHRKGTSDEVQKMKAERKKQLEEVYERRWIIAKRRYLKLRLLNRQGMV